MARLLIASPFQDFGPSHLAPTSLPYQQAIGQRSSQLRSEVRTPVSPQARRLRHARPAR